jgi:hypothetical protein
MCRLPILRSMRSVTIAVLLVAQIAHADEPRVSKTAPPRASPPPPPSITLPEGKVRVDTTVETEMSTGKVAKPVSIAPDLSFGAADDLMLGVVTSKFATSGFRGSAGGGFCATGANDGCAHVFNAGGIEAWYSLTTGALATALGGGPYATNIDQGFYAFKLGLKTRFTIGRFVSTMSPSVFVAATKRTDSFNAPVDKDTVYAPVSAGVKVTRAVTLAFGTGVKGTIEGWNKSWTVPLGASATIAATPDFTVGASWTFGSLVTGGTNPPPPMTPVEGMDLRVLQVWASYTR